MQTVFQSWPFRRWLSLGACPWILCFPLLSSLLAGEYRDNTRLSGQLKALAGEHSQIVHLRSLASTAGKNELWLVELGVGTEENRKNRPALLVVAGIEGNDLAGTASAVHWIEGLAAQYASDESIRHLLGTTTVYAFPRLNPDAAQRFFARPKLERATSDTPVDDDRDGLIDEDGPEDLDGDGLITWMRVEDPEGEYILDPADSRVLIKADKSKGEKGAWKLLTEGRDNDQDQQWNEDGPGGVNFNRNFPYNYSFFASWSGRHQVSELETRALADFVVAHPNIGIAFAFGAADNLLQTPKSEPGGKRPPAEISDHDLPFFRELGKTFREVLGLKKELNGAREPGTFSDWMYFHRGRLSLASRPWTPGLEMELAKSRKAGAEKPKQSAPEQGDAQQPNEHAQEKPETASKDSEPGQKSDEKKPDNRGEEERAMLKWFDEHAPEGFVDWKEFQHPDFPEQRVEIGGWAPFARSNPPEKLLDELAKAHAAFLTRLAGRLPRIGIRKAEARHLGNSVYELTLRIENTGYLPTALAQGALTREVLPTRAVLRLDDKQVLAGQRTTLLEPIEGSGGMKELRYIIHASGAVEIEVLSALGGSARQTIELREAP
jgi:hypothetical protein